MRKIYKKLFLVLIIIISFCILAFSQKSKLTQIGKSVIVEEVQNDLEEISAEAGGAGFYLAQGNGGNGHAPRELEQERQGDCRKGGGSDTNHMYTYVEDTFCAGHGWCLTRRKNYEPDSVPIVDGEDYGRLEQSVQYTQVYDKQMPQSIAFGRYFGADNTSMQKIVWSSWQWENINGEQTPLLNPWEMKDSITASNSGIQGRSYKFANFANLALNSSGRLGITGTPTTDNTKDLKIAIDQTANTYTIGPYMVSFPNQSKTALFSSGESMGYLVWDEINNSYLGKFCAGYVSSEVRYQDNSVSTATVGTGVGQFEIVDVSGASMGIFPQFGIPFYIRYHSEKDEVPVEMIKPSFQVKYYQKFEGRCYSYRSVDIWYNMTEDKGALLSNAITLWANTRSRNVYKVDSSDEYKVYVVPYYTWAGVPGTELNAGNNYTRNANSILSTYEDDIKTSLANFFEVAGQTWGTIKIDLHLVFNNGFYNYETKQLYESTGDITAWIRSKQVDGSGKTWYKSTQTGEETDDESKAEEWRDDGQDVEEFTKYKYIAEVVLRTEYGNTNESVTHTTGQFDSEYDAKEDAAEWARKNLMWGFKIISVFIKETNDHIQPAVQFSKVTAHTSSEGGTLAGREINMYLGGNAWEDMPSIKIGDYNGQRQDSSVLMAGMQVELLDVTDGSGYKNHVVARTTTDAEGDYGFQKLHPLHKYQVIFTYDGVRFEDTKYEDNLTGGFSTAEELDKGGASYTDDVSNGSRDIDSRENINTRFYKIETSPGNYNYGGWKKAYGLYTKIEGAGGSYIKYTNSGTNGGAFRYYDALEVFKNNVVNTNNFDRPSLSGYYPVGLNSGYSKIDEGYDKKKGSVTGGLTGVGISSSEAESIWNYMMDTMIEAQTIPYPKENLFLLDDVEDPTHTPLVDNTTNIPFLYNSTSDQSRNVDFGVKLRDNADLWLSKDVYKATVLINGKQNEYIYNKKTSEVDSSGSWVVNLDANSYTYGSYIYRDNSGREQSDTNFRSGNPNYIGEKYGGLTYTREIRKSEYLYDNSIYGENDEGDINTRDLQVFVTYKIAVKNQSLTIYSTIDEIVDYYDTSQYEFIPSNPIIKDNTFLGNSKGVKYYGLNEGFKVENNSVYEGSHGTGAGFYNNNNNYNINGYSNNSNNLDDFYQYGTLYLKDIKKENNDSRLGPGDIVYAYITFKVKQDPRTGNKKVKIDQVLDSVLNNSNPDNVRDTVGKKNIAEINGYTTAFQDGTKAGVIDLDSNPGSLRPNDMDRATGDIISSSEQYLNRLEDDTDKASNIKLVIEKTQNRAMSGYVYEDARNRIENQAVIGNGRFNANDKDTLGNSDKKVDGVTIQLVELVKKVDSYGLPTGEYIKEFIWETFDYNTAWIPSVNSDRYYSGEGNSKVVLSGPGILDVQTTTGLESGAYMFDSIPPGDFLIRFTYGDTGDTVLVNDDNNEVIQLLKSSSDSEFNNKVLQLLKLSSNSENIKGKNSISYTGQDYKSTIYQEPVDQSIEKYGSYNGISGFISSNQNYTMKDLENGNKEIDVNDKKTMYYYNIANSHRDSIVRDAIKVGPGISDAKDVYIYREEEQEYSKGSPTLHDGENVQTLKNYRAEVLASATQLTTDAKKLLEAGKTEEAIAAQVNAILELINYTHIVAQTGVINTYVEYNTPRTEVYNDKQQYVQNISYHIDDIDFGITERPRAQLLLSKELINIQIRLANNQILFDTTQTIPNLYYGEHYIYSDKDVYQSAVEADNLNKKPYMLRCDVMVKVKNRVAELVAATMDEELMYGATIRLKYKISVDNIGEVDYEDKDFYYKGKTSDPSVNNIARTSAVRVIDYISDELNYDENYQKDVADWTTITVESILGEEENYDDDLVNHRFKDYLDTYKTLVTTERLSGNLLPRFVDDTENHSESRREIELVLSTLLANTVVSKDLVFTNLVELLESTNTMGRRMYLSEAGNQQMPYQSERDSEDESTDWTHPDELDADSGQKVQVSVPTGENRDYNRLIVVCIISLVIIGVSAVLIKKNVLDKKV